MQAQAPKALLFDLGGVLVDIDFSRALSAWAVHSKLSVEDLERKFQFDKQYERHERGEMDGSEYFDHLASILELAAACEDVERGWNAVFVGEVQATRELVEVARRSLPCYAFTNTNASHMATWSKRFPQVVGLFDRIFASHEIGLRKPQRAAFEYICGCTGYAAESFLFFDDLPENVHAAAEAGLRAVLVRTPEDVAAALEGLGGAKRLGVF